MKRRTVLQTLASAVALHPLGKLPVRAQVPPAPPAGLSAANIATLTAIAEVVLPTALGRVGRNAAVTRFGGWVRNYKQGADRGHGYGSSTLSAPTGPSPALQYPAQFAALDKAAEAHGAATFAALPLAARQTIVETALNTPQQVSRLPARPTGANLVADFMGLYFNSPEGFDLAYDAAIGRDTCRSLDGSDRAPGRRS
jgi:hypothetical protein